jgi:hypothetical protein
MLPGPRPLRFAVPNQQQSMLEDSHADRFCPTNRCSVGMRAWIAP